MDRFLTILDAEVYLKQRDTSVHVMSADPTISLVLLQASGHHANRSKPYHLAQTSSAARQMQPNHTPASFNPLVPSNSTTPASAIATQPAVTRALAFSQPAMYQQGQAPLTASAPQLPQQQPYYGASYAMQPQFAAAPPPGQAAYPPYTYGFQHGQVGTDKPTASVDAFNP